MSQYSYEFEKEAFKNKLLGALLGGAKDLAVRGGTKALDFGKKMVAPGTSAYQAAKATGKSTARALGEATKDQTVAAGKALQTAGKAVYDSPTAQAAGKRVADATAPVTSRVGRLGQFTTDLSRNALNMGDEAVARMRNPGKNRPAGGGWGLGDRLISPTDANPMSLRNVGVGTGVAYGGARSLGLTGGASSPEDSVYTPVAPGAAMPTPTPNYTASSGGGGFLGGIPKEMQYAAAAGIPLALLGAYMGGGKGMGMGALGLGALGLGAAGSGYFGDDARRLVGQGANSLMGLFGGNQNGDMLSQIEQLSNLSPEFGVTMLMGKNPGMTREDAEQMYHFLTQNKGVISKMAPMIMGARTPMAKAGALLAVSAELEKAARCWKGYEPVPGKAPYSDNSCRPVGSGKKKKKTTEKKSAAPAWQRSAGKNEEGGLNEKGRKSYERETGGNLKAPVTESNPKGERAKRQNSFCSRMCGMKKHETGSKTKKDPDSRINKSLRKWNCKCAADDTYLITNDERGSMLTPYDFGRALVKSAAFPFDSNNVLTSGAGGSMSGGSSPTMSLARGPAAQQPVSRPAVAAQPAVLRPAINRGPGAALAKPTASPPMTGTSATGQPWNMSGNSYTPRPVGSTPVPTLSLARPDGMRPQPTLTTSGTRPGQVTPVAPAKTPTIAPVSTFKDRAKYMPPAAKAPAAAAPAAKPEMTADDYSAQAKKMLAELNARRRTAGGEVADAGKVNEQVNALLARANKMRNAPGYKPSAGDNVTPMVQQLNADRARAGGEVANVGQRMQAINNASRNYDTSSWASATRGVPNRMPVNPSRAPLNGPPVQGGPVQVAKR